MARSLRQLQESHEDRVRSVRLWAQSGYRYAARGCPLLTPSRHLQLLRYTRLNRAAGRRDLQPAIQPMRKV